MLAPEFQMIYITASTGSMYEAIENGNIANSLITLVSGIALAIFLTYAIIVISKKQITKIKKESFIENR